MSLLDNECSQNHIFYIAALVHKWYSCPFHRLNKQDGVNQENLDYSYEGIIFFLFQLLYSFFKYNVIRKIHFYNYNGKNASHDCSRLNFLCNKRQNLHCNTAERMSFSLHFFFICNVY